MPVYEVLITYHSTAKYRIEADSKQEAREKAYEGEFGDEDMIKFDDGCIDDVEVLGLYTPPTSSSS